MSLRSMTASWIFLHPCTTESFQEGFFLFYCIFHFCNFHLVLLYNFYFFAHVFHFLFASIECVIDYGSIFISVGLKFSADIFNFWFILMLVSGECLFCECLFSCCCDFPYSWHGEWSLFSPGHFGYFCLFVCLNIKNLT